MIIKLTNATTAFKGKTLLINTRYIIAIFEAEIEGKIITSIYGALKDNWEVQETVEEIEKLLSLDNVN